MNAPFLLCLAALFAVSAASAQTLQTLHTFTGQPADGSRPECALVKGADGNLWGTTAEGGANNSGTIYKLDPQSGAYALVYTFSALQELGNGAEVNSDGYAPDASLTLASDSNLYGVAPGGGANGNGVIFEITAAGGFTAVYNFAAYNLQGQNSAIEVNPIKPANADGAGPEGQLISGSDGNLYGTTEGGGTNGQGTVFQFNPSTHQLVTLYNFSALTGTLTNADGAGPAAGLLQVGNYFYGTTQAGGSGGEGTVFKVDVNGNFTTVHNFTTVDANGHNPDGANPIASLVLGPDGNLYGTAQYGGANGNGAIFEVTAGGAFSVLYTFSATPETFQSEGPNGDGAFPAAPLLLGSDGDLYGTTELGGANGDGAAFQITTGGVLTLLHSFGKFTNPGGNKDGGFPEGGLIELTPGVFYGGAAINGQQADGTVFELELPENAPVITSPATASGTAQTAFSYQITATNQPTSFGAQNLPAGLTLDASSGLISGTLPSTAGIDQVTLSATNSGGTGTAVLTLTVTAAPVNAPVINSALSASGQAGQAFNYQITATNQPTSFGADNLPPGLTLDAGSGLISGTLGSDSGAFQISLSATNSGGTGTAVLTLTVTPPPVIPPVITSAASATGQVGQAFNYQIVASAMPTSYSAAGLPPGLTVDASAGLISGTPMQAGAFSVTLSAANSGGAGSATLNLTIAPALPVVSIVVPVPEVTLGSAKPGVFKVKLSAAQPVELIVEYTIEGTAINGADYLLLTGKKKFKPGVTRKKIKIEPLGDLEGAAKKTVKITLTAGSGYTLGATTSAKVKILAAP